MKLRREKREGRILRKNEAGEGALCEVERSRYIKWRNLIRIPPHQATAQLQETDPTRKSGHGGSWSQTRGLAFVPLQLKQMSPIRFALLLLHAAAGLLVLLIFCCFCFAGLLLVCCWCCWLPGLLLPSWCASAAGLLVVCCSCCCCCRRLLTSLSSTSLLSSIICVVMSHECICLPKHAAVTLITRTRSPSQKHTFEYVHACTTLFPCHVSVHVFATNAPWYLT